LMLFCPSCELCDEVGEVASCVGEPVVARLTPPSRTRVCRVDLLVVFYPALLLEMF
jgi:hypothetical protein